MIIASLGAMLIGFLPDAEPQFVEGIFVMLFFQVGELFEHIATGKSKNAISNAIDLRADTANLITDNKVVEVKPETLKVGDKILVRIGEIVPKDLLFNHLKKNPL